MPTSSPPTVSVVLPAYNRAEQIGAAIDSILRQTFGDFELIVVDDGSTDDTLARAQAMSDPRIRCLSSASNRGVSAARNLGLAVARGEWVAFQDSDDEWLPAKLEKQLARLRSASVPCVGAYCGMAIMLEGPGEGRQARTTLRYIPNPDLEAVEGDILPTLLRTSLVSTQTLIARRDCLERIGGFDEELRALVDWDCVIRLAQLGPFAFVDEPLVLQRFSANSITRDTARRAVARRQIIEKHRDLLAGSPAQLAHHYRTLAGEQRRLGQVSEALGTISQARRIRPFALQLWIISAYLAVLGAGRRLLGGGS